MNNQLDLFGEHSAQPQPPVSYTPEEMARRIAHIAAHAPQNPRSEQEIRDARDATREDDQPRYASDTPVNQPS